MSSRRTQAVLAIVVGVLILALPQLLNLFVGIFLIVFGILHLLSK